MISLRRIRASDFDGLGQMSHPGLTSNCHVALDHKRAYIVLDGDGLSILVPVSDTDLNWVEHLHHDGGIPLTDDEFKVERMSVCLEMMATWTCAWNGTLYLDSEHLKSLGFLSVI